jgi:hypothetical protein
MKDNNKYFNQKRKQFLNGEQLSQGTIKACNTYFFRHGDELELSDFLWDREVHDFIETMRNAGIKSFVFTNTSTAVMDNLHSFAEEGCTIDGLCIINETKGIRININ